jgi:hypothetical protein
MDSVDLTVKNLNQAGVHFHSHGIVAMVHVDQKMVLAEQNLIVTIMYLICVQT